MKFEWIKILLLVALTAIFYCADGQSFYGGAKAGINGCQVGGDNLAGYHKFGFLAGGFVGVRFTPKSGLRLELEYSQKGSRELPPKNSDYNGPQDVGNNFRIQEHCIDMPIMYQFFLARWMSLEAGLSGSYLFSHKETQWGIESGSEHWVPFSLNIVAGVHFHINKNLFINFRTSNGLTPFRKTSDGYARRRLGAYGQYNDILTLSVGWDFGKGAID